MTGDETGAARFPERAKGYDRVIVRQYLESLADMREAGVAPAQYKQPNGFPRRARLRGYDPETVDRHVAELASEAAAAGLLVLPELPVSTSDAHRAGLGRMRPEWRQLTDDRQADWQRVSVLPGARLTLTRSKPGYVSTVTDGFGEALLTRRRSTISLATGHALRVKTSFGGYSSPTMRGDYHRKVTDAATGDPVLWTKGAHVDGKAGGHVLFPGQRYLVFPVSGTRPGNAVMTAVGESGTTLLWVRRIAPRKYEIVVSPDCHLTAEMLCAIDLTANWLHYYFALPG
jgi:hypothetical protein